MDKRWMVRVAHGLRGPLRHWMDSLVERLVRVARAARRSVRQAASRDASLGPMRIDARAMLNAAVDYVKENPEELFKAAVNAAGLRIAVPIAGLRWLASQAPPGKKGPRDIEIGSVPPALRVSVTVDMMGTPLRASAAIRVDEVEVGVETLRLGMRLSDVRLGLLGDSDAPVATLIKSGALDLSKPGNLVKFIPKRPAAIIEAEGDRIVIDLMKVTEIAEHAPFRRALAVLTPVVSIRAIDTDRDHLYVSLRTNLRGLRKALNAVRQSG